MTRLLEAPTLADLILRSLLVLQSGSWVVEPFQEEQVQGALGALV